MITKFNYTIQNEDQIFCDNIDSRHSARTRLREVKSLGFKTAKIVREEFVKISEKVVR